MSSDTQAYIEREVRNQDRDRYLTSLFAPSEFRSHLWALYAFNVELARIRETVSEPMMGEIRLQWWRDAVDAMGGEGAVPHQPVAEAVADLVKSGRLDRDRLHALIDARVPELYDELPADMAALETRINAIHGMLNRCAAIILGGAEADSDAAAAAGTAWGLVHILKESARYAAVNRIQLPETRMQAHDVKPADLMAAGGTQGQRALMGEVAARVRHHFDQAVRGRPGDKRQRSPFLLVALARSDLKALNAAHFNPKIDIAARPGAGRLIRLYWAGLTGRI